MIRTESYHSTTILKPYLDEAAVKIVQSVQHRRLVLHHSPKAIQVIQSYQQKVPRTRNQANLVFHRHCHQVIELEHDITYVQNFVKIFSVMQMPFSTKQCIKAMNQRWRTNLVHTCSIQPHYRSMGETIEYGTHCLLGMQLL